MEQNRTLIIIRRWALGLSIPVALELVYYSYRSFARAWRFCFGEPERWNSHWAVDPGTVIETGPRIGYFLLWGSVNLASILCYVIGLALLIMIWRGRLFDPLIGRVVRLLGGALAFSMAWDQLFQAFDLYLVTRFNADGPHPIRWVYDPSDIKSFSLGVILFLFGWVMLKGLDVARENRSFV